MMRLVFDTPSWFYSKKNSDWQMKLKLAAGLNAFSPEIQKGFIYIILYSAKFILPRFFPKRFSISIQKVVSRLIGKILSRDESFCFLTQSLIPPIPKGAKVIWETYFLPPSDEKSLLEFRRGGRNIWIRAIEEFGPQVSKIAVRGESSVKLLCEMYPEFSDKVVNLSFIHKEFYIARESEVLQKQKMDGALNITFVGRESRRKGLVELIAALKILRNELGVCNFVFNIVSNFNDGIVELPNEDWINYYKELPHNEVLHLMQKSQLFVMPSHFESYGLVYLEAMAAGCVVIARDGEPQREFMNYGHAGFNINASDVKGIAKILEMILQDSDLRCRIAVAAVERYKVLYSQARVYEDWVKVLNEILQESQK